MLHFNWLFIIGAGVIPLLTGFVWYNQKVFGNAWMKASGMTMEKAQGSNMPLIFGLTFVFGVFMALAMMTIVIHQTHYFSILADNKDMLDPNSEASKAAQAFMDVNGSNFRTFKHGAFHGTIAALLFAMPVIGILSLFEAKGRNYIFVHTGYWILTLALMGGVICAFG